MVGEENVIAQFNRQKERKRHMLLELQMISNSTLSFPEMLSYLTRQRLYKNKKDYHSVPSPFDPSFIIDARSSY